MLALKKYGLQNVRNALSEHEKYFWQNMYEEIKKDPCPNLTVDRLVVKTLVLALEKTHSCQIDPLCTFLHLHAGLRK